MGFNQPKAQTRAGGREAGGGAACCASKAHCFLSKPGRGRARGRDRQEHMASENMAAWQDAELPIHACLGWLFGWGLQRHCRHWAAMRHWALNFSPSCQK